MNNSRPDLSQPRDSWTLSRGIRQAVVLAAIMFSSLGLYLVVLKWRGPAGNARLTYVEALDEVFPFRPGWVWAYLVPYLIGPLLVGFLSRPTFRWYVQRGLALVGLTLLIFIVFPTQTRLRDKVALGDSLTAQVYQQMIELDDPPANAAPSLHVSLTCLLALALVRDFPRWWLPSFAAAVLVWLATLYTRQHHVFDVVTGALMACLVALPWPLGKKEKEIGRMAGQEKKGPADRITQEPVKGHS